MKFFRMGHVAIHVKDVEKSLRWYESVLGLKGRWTKDQDWANLKLGNDDLSLVASEKAKHPVHCGFRVKTKEDLQIVHADLLAKGVEVEKISGHRDGSISFYFKDPDGNYLEALWDPKIEEAIK
jgi:catechol-2,3-dioxygenase